MLLKDIIGKLVDIDGLVIIVEDCGNVIGIYTDRGHISEYENCQVETIGVAEYGTLIVTVDASVGE